MINMKVLLLVIASAAVSPVAALSPPNGKGVYVRDGRRGGCVCMYGWPYQSYLMCMCFKSAS